MATLYISPTGSGTRDGSSWDNAGTLADLPAYIAAAGAGGRVLLRADAGAYAAPPGNLDVVDGGDPGNPVTVTGVDGAGQPMQAEIVGTRTDPWVATGDDGQEVFRLLEGADHLRFENLAFSNVGNGAFRVGADISDLALVHMSARNIERFLENTSSGGAGTATIHGLLLSDIEVHGFTRGVARLRYDTHDVLIEDVLGDSERQIGDSFAMGIHLDGTVHDVVVRRAAMLNARDSGDGYQNGDGFATEGGVHHVLFEDTVARGNADGGYDIKSSETTLVRATAEGSARNFRIWSQDAVLDHVVGFDPRSAQVWLSKGAKATVIGSHFSDLGPETIVFDLRAGSAILTVDQTSVLRSPISALVNVDDGSVANIGTIIAPVSGSGTLDGTPSADFLRAASRGPDNGGGPNPSGNDVLTGHGGDDALDGNDGDDRLVGGAGADVLIGGTGFDEASYATSAAGVAVDLASGRGQGGDAQGDRLFGIEAATGSALADVLTGDDGANQLAGGGGADLLAAAGGNDRLIGGSGGDALYGGAGADVASYRGSLAGVTIDLATGAAAGGDASGDILMAIEGLEGSDFADDLAGDGGDNLLDGGLGADVLRGGLGNDTYGVDSAADSVIENPSGGIDLVRTTLVSYTLGFQLENLAFVAAGAFAGTGNDLANAITGGGANDVIDGREGDDVLEGGAGSDMLIGGAGFDLSSYAGSAAGVSVNLSTGFPAGGDAQGDALFEIEGLQGSGLADALTGDAGVNRLLGGAGGDILDGAGGGDILDGGAGDDVFIVDTPFDAVLEAADGGFDEIRTALFGYALQLNVEALTYTGGGAFAGIGNALWNMLTGGAGADFLDGGAGDDTLRGGGGADTLIGGLGTDVASYGASFAGVTVSLATGSGLGGEAAGDKLAEIENLAGSVHNDVLTGDGFANVLSGEAGDDRLDGGAGSDLLDGGAGSDALTGGMGDDTYLVADVGDSVFEQAGGGVDLVRTTLSTYALGVDLEDLLFLGAGPFGATGNGGANTIVGGAADDRLDAAAGDDRLAGGAGADQLIGGLGFDTALYATSAAAVTVTLAAGTGKGGDAQGDVLSGIEAVLGSSFNDVLTGSAEANRLAGGYGGDWLDGGLGVDTLEGGAGDDTFTVDAVGDIVVEAPGDGTDEVRTTLSSYVLGATLERLIALGSAPFAGTGNALDNYILGAAGSDTLVGNEGDDILKGQGGADVLNGGAGRDSAYYTSAKSGVAINLATGLGTAGEAAGDILIGIEAISASSHNDTLTGDDGADDLYGRGGNDIIDGGAGNDNVEGDEGSDVLTGGLGDDMLRVESAGDQVIERAGEGIDTVAVRLGLQTYALTANVENLAYWSNLEFHGLGNELGNRIGGGVNKDTLEGIAGDDTLDGGAGADQLIGGTGFDVASYLASARGVTVNLATNVNRGGDAQGDLLFGIEGIDGSAFADRLAGNASANTLRGKDGDDSLDGGAAADAMAGGRGNDTYVVDHVADQTNEAAGEGQDSVLSSMTFALSSEVENLALTGSKDRNGTGNGLDNILLGNSGKNTLVGGAGNDTLDGGGQIDVMIGGEGDDVYVTGNVADRAVEAAGEGTDTVRSSASFVLAAEVERLVLEGSSALNGTGNAAANTLLGNAGNNVLDGAGGVDALTGNAGADRFMFKAGEANGDIVADFTGAGVSAGDRLMFQGYGPNATLVRQGNTDFYTVSNAAGTIVETIRLVGVINLDTVTGGAHNDVFFI